MHLNSRDFITFVSFFSKEIWTFILMHNLVLPCRLENYFRKGGNEFSLLQQQNIFRHIFSKVDRHTIISEFTMYSGEKICCVNFHRFSHVWIDLAFRIWWIHHRLNWSVKGNKLGKSLNKGKRIKLIFFFAWNFKQTNKKISHWLDILIFFLI